VTNFANGLSEGGDLSPDPRGSRSLDDSAARRRRSPSTNGGGWSSTPDRRRHIVTMDAERRIITTARSPSLGDRIAALGKRADIEPGSRRARDRRWAPVRDDAGFVMATSTRPRPWSKAIFPRISRLRRGGLALSVPLMRARVRASNALPHNCGRKHLLRTGTTCFLEAGTIIAPMRSSRGSGNRHPRRVGQWVLDRAVSADQNQTALTDRALRAGRN